MATSITMLGIIGFIVLAAVLAVISAIVASKKGDGR